MAIVTLPLPARLRRSLLPLFLPWLGRCLFMCAGAAAASSTQLAKLGASFACPIPLLALPTGVGVARCVRACSDSPTQPNGIKRQSDRRLWSPWFDARAPWESGGTYVSRCSFPFLKLIPVLLWRRRRRHRRPASRCAFTFCDRVCRRQAERVNGVPRPSDDNEHAKHVLHAPASCATLSWVGHDSVARPDCRNTTTSLIRTIFTGVKNNSSLCARLFCFCFFCRTVFFKKRFMWSICAPASLFTYKCVFSLSPAMNEERSPTFAMKRAFTTCLQWKSAGIQMILQVYIFIFNFKLKDQVISSLYHSHTWTCECEESR